MVKEKKKKVDVVGGLGERWEKMVNLAAGRLHDKRKRILTVIGSRPYKGLPVKEDEILSRFAQIQHDPQALTEILKKNAIFKSDGRVLLPKPLITKMKQMTAKLRKGEIE